MIYKIIHSLFEIDLLDKGIDYTEQNQWFVDGVPLNYSLPVSFILTQELDEAFNMISHINSDNLFNPTTFDVKLHKMNKIHDAVLVIEAISQLSIEISIKYGFEEYPNFNKSLRQLPLEQKTVTSLRADGLTVKSQIWPETNYKYPAVILPADVLENSSGRFNYFENVLNLLEAGVYVENVFDAQTNEAINRTIMHPFAYVLHVLQVGFADAGYTLQGDILEDEKLQKLLIGIISDFYTDFESDQEEWIGTTFDFIDTPIFNDGKPIVNQIPSEVPIIDSWWYNYFDTGYFILEENITESGRYKLAGNLNIRKGPLVPVAFRILIDDEEVYSYYNSQLNSTPINTFITIDFNFDVTTTSVVKLITVQTKVFNEEQEEIEANVYDLTLTKLANFDNQELIPVVNESNQIRLNRTMPNKNFGDLVKAIMAWRNYDIHIDVASQAVIMNQITDIINSPVTQDISFSEVRFPTKEFNQIKSYLLQFQPKVDDEQYQKVLFSRRGAQTTDFITDENTTEINIDLYPLLNTSNGTITTATFTDKNDSDITVFFDDGVGASNNTQNPSSLLLLPTFQEVYERWLNFRLYATTYKWTNRMPIEEALLLQVSSKSYAYNQVHYIKQLIVRILNKDIAEVEFETEA